jgi:hypothetical protein
MKKTNSTRATQLRPTLRFKINQRNLATTRRHNSKKTIKTSTQIHPRFSETDLTTITAIDSLPSRTNITNIFDNWLNGAHKKDTDRICIVASAFWSI